MIRDNIAVNPKFDDLPLIPPITSVMYPQHDGDMAELRELADRVLSYSARGIVSLAHRNIERETRRHTGIYPQWLLNDWHTLTAYPGGER